jgi:hypothetical protein
MEFFRHSTSKVYKRLIHLSSIEHLISSVKLGVGLFHEGYPELIVIRAMTIEDSLALAIVRDSGIYDDVLPTSILEELEHGETVLDTIIDNQIVKKLWISALDQEGA